jgi:hypothetical protein
MTDTKPMLADPRRRNLAIFTGVALLCALLAWLGLHNQAATVAPKYAETEFLPGFAAHVREAAHIHIASKKNGTFDVVFKPNKGWVLPQKNDYPASFEEVNKTLVALAALETIEPKTARPDWLHYIGLDDPAHGGDGVDITVSDDRSRVLAAIVIGKAADIGDANGATGLFVRKPNDPQSWLVRAEYTPRSDRTDWIDKNVLDIDRTRIQSTTVDLPDGKSFELRREKRTDTAFTLAEIPAGREMGDPSTADGLATAITGLTFDDIKPSKDMDFSNGTKLVTKTFDGLAITADILHVGTEYWAAFGAMALANTPEIGKQARVINARVNGWAYKLPDYKGAQFVTPLESLLKPKGGKPAAAP